MRVQNTFNKNPGKSGFTLVELMVVVGIIGILSTMAISNYSGSRTRAKITKAMDELRTLATGVEVYRTEYNAFPFTFPIQNCDEEKYLKDQLKENIYDGDFSAVIKRNEDLLNLYVPPKLGFGVSPHYSKKIYSNSLGSYYLTKEQTQPGWGLKALVKPLAYMSEIPNDVFDRWNKFHYYYYTNNSYSIRYFREHIPVEYYLFSVGPDQGFENGSLLDIYGLTGDKENEEQSKKFISMISMGDQLDKLSERFMRKYDVTNGLNSHGDICRKGP